MHKEQHTAISRTFLREINTIPLELLNEYLSSKDGDVQRQVLSLWWSKNG